VSRNFYFSHCFNFLVSILCCEGLFLLSCSSRGCFFFSCSSFYFFFIFGLLSSSSSFLFFCLLLLPCSSVFFFFLVLLSSSSFLFFCLLLLSCCVRARFFRWWDGLADLLQSGLLLRTAGSVSLPESRHVGAQGIILNYM